MLVRLLKTSLAVRTAAIILLLVAVTGVVFVFLAASLTTSSEQWRQAERLDGLLDTVEQTVSIAAYLGDRELASEVVEGLMKNSTVSGVTIRADGEVLAQAGGDPADVGSAGEVLSRYVHSPFDAAERVGTIALVPNEAEIDEEVYRATRFVTALLTVLLLLIGAGIVAVVIRLITRPILQISDRLHRLRAELGEKLEPPRGNRHDEIGQLVQDVNALIDHLVSLLHNERELRREREIGEKRLRTIFDNVDSGIFVLDRYGLVESGNPAFRRLFDLPAAEEPGGEPVALAALVEQDGEAPGVDDLLRECLDSGEPGSRDFRVPRTDNVTGRWVNVVLSPLGDSQLQGVVNDVTRRKLSELAAQKSAMTDTLTGLGNRLAFEHELDNLLDGFGGGAAGPFALLMVDLDRFKQVNDTHGHDAGDVVLVHVARLLEKCVRQSDFLARLGGDEFVVILRGAGERRSVASVVEKFLAGVKEPVPVGHEVSAQIGASVGVAIHGVDGTGASELVRRADKAMYRAKRAGGSSYRFHADLAGEDATP